MLNTRKGMNLLLFGAAVLMLFVINVSADEEIPLIHTASVEDDLEQIEEPIDETPMMQDESEGERGNLENLPAQENEDILIVPYTDEDNLIAPVSGTEEDVFILDAGSQIEAESQVKSTDTPFNFPVVLSLLCIGTIALLYIGSKR